MRQRIRLLGSGLMVAWVLGSQPVAAQDDAANADDEARGLFLAGQAAFDGGRFEEALEHFERSYELSGRPELLYNIGTTAERLRRDARAIEAYELYLERMTDPPHRANVEGRLRILQDQSARDGDEASTPEASPVPEPATPSAEETSTESSSNAGIGWGLSAGGFALLAGGALSLGLAAASANAASDVDEGTPWLDVSGDAERVDRRRAIGIGLLAVGVALSTVGLILVSTSDSGDGSVALRVGPSQLTLEGRF